MRLEMLGWPDNNEGPAFGLLPWLCNTRTEIALLCSWPQVLRLGLVVHKGVMGKRRKYGRGMCPLPRRMRMGGRRCMKRAAWALQKWWRHCCSTALT